MIKVNNFFILIFLYSNIRLILYDSFIYIALCLVTSYATLDKHAMRDLTLIIFQLHTYFVDIYSFNSYENMVERKYL